MLLGLATAALVVSALVWVLAWPSLRARLLRIRSRAYAWRAELARGANGARELDYDPGRERRAEQRARALLRSCVNEQEWAMYRDLGFLRVFGRAGTRYAYLIYPHKPIVAYVPQTGALLSEYCVAFPDHSRPYGSARLPDSDDVLAKWMALRADERGLIADANMHLPGRQVDPELLRRDLARLADWERESDELPTRLAGPAHAPAAVARWPARRARAHSAEGWVAQRQAGQRARDPSISDRQDGLGGWDPDNVPNRVTLATEAGRHSLTLTSPVRPASPNRPAA